MQLNINIILKQEDELKFVNNSPMENNLSIIQKPILENNCLVGFMLISDIKQPFKVSFDLEREVLDINEFEPFVKDSYVFVKKITRITILELLRNIAKDLVDSSYDQSDYLPVSEDYLDLENDMNIVQLNFYKDDIVIDILSQKKFPDMKIYCQVDHDLAIIDLGIV